ncbi:MAG: hypothetical protein A3J94_14260 [Syntrophus sp. RIFOXYC2_FULL_54_9]|nr:MAG: hypothetical protein A3J94_14260 [Syntrophus sp. RIFOXYC2_FULL_54_9]
MATIPGAILGALATPYMPRRLFDGIATATSQFVLTNMALTGTLTHIATGAFTQGIRRTILLAIGVLLGAQLGARLSRKTQGTWIIRGLAFALGAVGIRLLIQNAHL